LSKNDCPTRIRTVEPLSASVTSGSTALGVEFSGRVVGVAGGVESGLMVVAGDATAVPAGSIVDGVADVAIATTVAAGVAGVIGVRDAVLSEPHAMSTAVMAMAMPIDDKFRGYRLVCFRENPP